MTATAVLLSTLSMSVFGNMAIKTNELVSPSANRYEVTVSVPGTEEFLYNEIIIMVDRSGSQSENFEEIKRAVQQIGERVLSATGNTKLTLMSFDVSGRTVIEKAGTYEQLVRILSTLKASDMYNGLEVSNCEAGFTYISDYINDSPNLLNSYVFYISNGEASASDEPIVWDAWDTDEYGYMRGKKTDDYFKKSGDLWVPNAESSYTVEEIIELTMGYEVQNFYHDGKYDGTLAPATEEIFGDAFEEIIENLENAKGVKSGDSDVVTSVGDKKNVDEQGFFELIKPLLKEDPDQDGVTLGEEWLDLAWNQAYDAAGLTIGTPYAYSVVERAFAEYDSSSNQTWLMSFFNSTYGYKAHFEDIHSDYTLSEGTWYYYRDKKGQRAAARAMELSESEKVETLYLLGVGPIYGGSCYGSWMVPTEESKANQAAYVYAEGEKIHSQMCGNMAGVFETLKGYASKMAEMPYHDVYVTDYTGEGVTLLPETIKIYDGNYVIYYYNKSNNAFEWTVGVKAPTEKNPITVELITDGADANEGSYKITWNIKDGSFLNSDEFHLRYDVIVQEEKTPDGTAMLHYYNPSGDLLEEEIEVLVMESSVVGSGELGTEDLAGSEGMLMIEDNDTPLGFLELEDMEVPLGNLPGSVEEVPEETESTKDIFSSFVSMTAMGIDILLTKGYEIIFGK